MMINLIFTLHYSNVRECGFNYVIVYHEFLSLPSASGHFDLIQSSLEFMIHNYHDIYVVSIITKGHK